MIKNRARRRRLSQLPHPTRPRPPHTHSHTTQAALSAWLTTASPALADAADGAPDASVAAAASSGLPFGFSPLEAAIAVAPLLFYGILTAYRSLVNPKASISDVLFLLAAFLIVGNLASGLVFKVRLF
jgi:hypothetical protein